MNVQTILNVLSDSNFRETGTSYGGIETGFEIKPNDFLEFAEKDLMSDYSHKDINALSNAKRALDCQLDSLLMVFNLYSLAQRENWNFPKKVEVVRELGIVAPRVLKKINAVRNLMEHEFTRPNSEQISDFIDIVALFFGATDKYIYKLIYYLNFQVVRDLPDNKYEFLYEGTFQLESEKITVTLSSYRDNERQETEELEIKNDHPEYITLLSKYLNVVMKY